jgi:biotin carboxyl carrier protein
MKKFNIRVNGKNYEVEVEEIGGISTAAPVAAPKPAATPKPVVESKPAAASKPATSKPEEKPAAAPKEVPSGGTAVNSPMPGTILDIKVQEGDTVSSGQVLLILEAMKMENEIMAPADGKVASIHVQKGASVNAGDVLVVLV